MARMMGEAGAKVVLNARNAERLKATYELLKGEGLDVFPVAGDVSNYEDCQKLIDETIAHYGQIDVVVNNAGISMEGSIEELSPEVFKKVMEVNYLGSVYPTKYALPYLKKTRGSVILISSAAGIRGIPGFSVYSSSKMALTALAESLQIELEKDEIHVGIAYVGFTENDPQKTIYDANGKIIPQPNRNLVKTEPPENVAKRVIKMIENRTFKNVFTPLGKLNAFMNRFAPFVVRKVLSNNYHK